MRKKFLIIHNKMAGRLKAPMLSSVLAQLEEQGVEVTLKAAASVEQDIELASSAARLKNVDAVIAAGGDSTIRGVAMGLVDTNMPLGIIPAGTGNVLAQEIELGSDPQKIARLLIEGNVKKINLGLANGQPFLLMAGVGLDAAIVRDLNHQLKQRIRKAAYIWPTLKALAAKPPLLSVGFKNDRDGEFGEPNYQAAFVVVTRARHYGGSFIIAPDADLASDQLQVVMFMNKGRFGLIRALFGLAMGHNDRQKEPVMSQGKLAGWLVKTPGVMIGVGKHVRIESADPTPAQIDGEYLPANADNNVGGQHQAGFEPGAINSGSVLEVDADGGRIRLITPDVS